MPEGLTEQTSGSMNILLTLKSKLLCNWESWRYLTPLKYACHCHWPAYHSWLSGVLCSLDSHWLPEYCFYDYGLLFTLLSSSLYRTWIPPSQQKTMYIHRISWWLCPISPICILGQGFLNKLDTFSNLLLQDLSNSIIVCITAHDYRAVFRLPFSSFCSATENSDLCTTIHFTISFILRFAKW